MANLAKITKTQPVRVLGMGYPGSGKTGSLAALANAGLKLRILAYDKPGNFAPLSAFIKPEFQPNVDIVYLEDKYRSGTKYIETAGLPTAFAGGFKLMDEWKYTDDDGTEVNLGASKDWGLDTVVVLDSLTYQGEAAKRRAMSALNKTPLNSTQQLWGLAMDDQKAFVEKMLSVENKFHSVVFSHLKLVGPKDIQRDDDMLTKELKERAAEIVKTRLFPTALGQQLPQTFAGLGFSAVILYERIVKARQISRVINTKPGIEIDVKLPALGLPDTLDISDGLLTVFKAVSPGGPKVWLANGGQDGQGTETKVA